MGKKIKFEDVYKYFKDHDCLLLETEYISAKTPMRYRCDCKNDECKITFSKFKSGQRCIECGGHKKFTFKDVQKYFKDQGCKLLETEYINCKTKMRYECKCGNPDCKISFDNFKKGTRCKECGIKKMADKRKLTFDFVYNYFEDHDCLLLETEYISSSTLMKYECECHNISEICFDNFKQGKRCKKCSIKRVSGENHWNYNSDLTDEEREKGRNYPEYREWREDIYERDDYTCQISGERGIELNAHHLESYDNNEGLRIVVSNGITIGKKYHKKFHKIYGRGNNTTEQFNEFLINIKNKVIKIN